MLLLILCLWCVSVDVIGAIAYKCNEPYQPSSYKGNTRVPTNCKVETPSDCPRSWKSGIPKGSETSNPLIYDKFLICHESSASCGYVPINPKNGEVLGQSGVTIGAGVDLGATSSNSPYLVSLSSDIVSKLEPYFGLKGNAAACAAIELPLILGSGAANTISYYVKQYITLATQERYNKDKASNALDFADLPRGIRTAIVSVRYQFGYPEAYPKFWKTVRENDWKGAIHELRHFYADESKQQRGDLRRRNNEADIIAATIVQCQRSLDAVILVDESGSVSGQSFNESLDFVKKLINAFPDDKLKGESGTRFGLSTFSSYYTSHFNLSSYKSQSDYLAAVDRVNKAGGGTNLGWALNQTLYDQFTKASGLRSNLPNILIVLTDGQSHDLVGGPAEHLRQNDIVIYAIGIGNYDINQLRELASPLFADSRIFTLLNYEELESIIATITATTCNEPQPVPLDKQLTALTTKDEYQYFLFIIKKSSNLEVTLNDLAGATVVYLSRSNPHPYKYDSDISFGRPSQKFKVIVIAPVERDDQRTKRDTSDEQPIYVAVQGTTELASFTIEAKTCDPRNCTEGTNEKSSAQQLGSRHSSFLIAAMFSLYAFFLY